MILNLSLFMPFYFVITPTNRNMERCDWVWGGWVRVSSSSSSRRSEEVGRSWSVIWMWWLN